MLRETEQQDRYTPRERSVDERVTLLRYGLEEIDKQQETISSTSEQLRSQIEELYDDLKNVLSAIDKAPGDERNIATKVHLVNRIAHLTTQYYQARRLQEAKQALTERIEYYQQPEATIEPERQVLYSGALGHHNHFVRFAKETTPTEVTNRQSIQNFIGDLANEFAIRALDEEGIYPPTQTVKERKKQSPFYSNAKAATDLLEGANQYNPETDNADSLNWLVNYEKKLHELSGRKEYNHLTAGVISSTYLIQARGVLFASLARSNFQEIPLSVLREAAARREDKSIAAELSATVLPVVNKALASYWSQEGLDSKARIFSDQELPYTGHTDPTSPLQTSLESWCISIPNGPIILKEWLESPASHIDDLAKAQEDWQADIREARLKIETTLTKEINEQKRERQQKIDTLSHKLQEATVRIESLEKQLQVHSTNESLLVRDKLEIERELRLHRPNGIAREPKKVNLMRRLMGEKSETAEEIEVFSQELEARLKTVQDALTPLQSEIEQVRHELARLHQEVSTARDTLQTLEQESKPWLAIDRVLMESRQQWEGQTMASVFAIEPLVAPVSIEQIENTAQAEHKVQSPPSTEVATEISQSEVNEVETVSSSETEDVERQEHIEQWARITALEGIKAVKAQNTLLRGEGSSEHIESIDIDYLLQGMTKSPLAQEVYDRLKQGDARWNWSPVSIHFDRDANAAREQAVNFFLQELDVEVEAYKQLLASNLDEEATTTLPTSEKGIGVMIKRADYGHRNAGYITVGARTS